VPLETLAGEQNMPERYLAKIIQDLRRSGLIRSVRGAHGGYLLNRAPKDIDVLDIWEALEGPLCPVECLDAPESCGTTAECVTRDVWEDLREAILGVLKSRDLATLAEQHKARHAKLKRTRGTRR
jgi:Rrf2 family protein